jgi:hypothetical protein
LGEVVKLNVVLRGGLMFYEKSSDIRVAAFRWQARKTVPVYGQVGVLGHKILPELFPTSVLLRAFRMEAFIGISPSTLIPNAACCIAGLTVMFLCPGTLDVNEISLPSLTFSDDGDFVML